MIEPPSKSLRETLLRLRICTAADFRCAKRRVRQLARDLPAFDFVWIDALLQLRRITPFQARLLETNNADRLNVGSYVLIDRLGDSQHSSTYLARPIDQTDRVVLKVIHQPESTGGTIAALEDLSFRLQTLIHPSVATPQAVFEHERSTVMVSRFIPGPHLRALLVRRGRFPSRVVAEIARQLIDALAELEASGVVHGDISSSNVRLTSGGAVVLVDAGIRPAVLPELIIQANCHPDRYDGVAPELIGTGAVPTVSSDMYALGCLLWHILAGRPPHYTGDPLGKLAAHQTRSIPDVRELAPDTPAELADVVARLTQADPSARPTSFRELRSAWGLRRNSRKIIARFLADFEGEASSTSGPVKVSTANWAVLVASVFVLTGAVLTMFDLGATSSTLRISGRFSNAVQRAKKWAGTRETGKDADQAKPAVELYPPGQSLQPEPRYAGNGKTAPQLAAIPSPDRDGVIRLEPGVRYEAESITAVGPLVIDGNAESPPEIVVETRPFQVAARDLTVRDVQFRFAPKVDASRSGYHGSRNPTALFLAQSQQLIVSGCTFLNADRVPDANGNRVAPAEARCIGVAWKPLDPLNRAGGGVQIQHCVLAGLDSSLHLAGRTSSVHWRNSLAIGGGSLLSLASGIGSGPEMLFDLRNMTLREMETLVRLRTAGPSNRVPRVSISADDCVFDLRGDYAALFQLVGERDPAEFPRLISMTGEGSVAVANVRVAAVLRTGAEQFEFPEIDSIEVEGISATRFQFAGSPGIVPAQSAIAPDSYQGLRRSNQLPGINAEALRLRTEPVATERASEERNLATQRAASRAEGPVLFAP